MNWDRLKRRWQDSVPIDSSPESTFSHVVVMRDQSTVNPRIDTGIIKRKMYMCNECTSRYQRSHHRIIFRAHCMAASTDIQSGLAHMSSLWQHAFLRTSPYRHSHSSPANALLNLTCELKSSQPARPLPSTLAVSCSSPSSTPSTLSSSCNQDLGFRLKLPFSLTS